MIVARNLSKSFNEIKAVDDVNFCIKKGEVVALLGPNGAGKTTLMRLLTGYLTPDGGETSVYGMNIAENRVAALGKIGYVPENAPLYPEMTVFEYLHFAAALRGLRKDDLLINLAEAVSQMKLAGVLNQRIETLSKGFRHRTAVAGALIHKPRILILDEPKVLTPIRNTKCALLSAVTEKKTSSSFPRTLWKRSKTSLHVFC